MIKVASLLKSLKANETEAINKGGDNIHLLKNLSEYSIALKYKRLSRKV